MGIAHATNPAAQERQCQPALRGRSDGTPANDDPAVGPIASTAITVPGVRRGGISGGTRLLGLARAVVPAVLVLATPVWAQPAEDLNRQEELNQILASPRATPTMTMAVAPDPTLQAEHPQAAYPQAAYPQAGYPQAGYPQAGYPQATYPYSYPYPYPYYGYGYGYPYGYGYGYGYGYPYYPVGLGVGLFFGCCGGFHHGFHGGGFHGGGFHGGGFHGGGFHGGGHR